MITKYTEVARMRLVVLVVLTVLVMPLFLMHSSILTPASATTDNTTTTTAAAISDIVSDVSSIQIAPVLLAPIATSGSNVYVV
jgi:hypothetical protein